MTDTLTLPKPKARRRMRKIDPAMRNRIEAAVETMIAALDALDAPDEDREEDDPGGGDVVDEPHDGGDDDEPSLGSFDRMVNQGLSYRQRAGSGGAWFMPGFDHELDPAEREPSLGSCSGSDPTSQEGWAQGTADDRELDDVTPDKSASRRLSTGRSS